MIKKITKFFLISALLVSLLFCGLELLLRSDFGAKWILNVVAHFWDPTAHVEFDGGGGSLIKKCRFYNIKIKHEHGTISAKHISIDPFGLFKYRILIADAECRGAISNHKYFVSTSNSQVTFDRGLKIIEIKDSSISLDGSAGSFINSQGINFFLKRKTNDPIFAFQITSHKFNYNKFNAALLTASGELNTTNIPELKANISTKESSFGDIRLGPIRSGLFLKKIDKDIKYEVNDLSVTGCLFGIKGTYKDAHLSGEISMASLSEQALKNLLKEINLQWIFPIIRAVKDSKLEFNTDGEKTDWKFKPLNMQSYVPVIEIQDKFINKKKITELTSQQQGDSFAINGQFFHESKDEFHGKLTIKNPGKTKLINIGDWQNFPVTFSKNAFITLKAKVLKNKKVLFSLYNSGDLFIIPVKRLDGEVELNDRLFSASFKENDNKSHLDVSGEYSNDSVKLSLLKIKSKAIEFHNKTDLILKNGIISGGITGILKDLNAFAGITGFNDINGRISFSVASKKSSFDVQLNTNKISSKAFSMHDASIRINNWQSVLPHTIKVTIKHGKINNVKYKNLLITAHKTSQSDLGYEVSCCLGRYHNSILFASGRLSALNQGIQSTIDKLTISDTENNLKLTSPAFIKLTKTQTKILIPKITVNNSGEVCLMFDKHQDNIDFFVCSKNFPISVLKIIDFDLYNFGTISSEFTCKGKTKSPIMAWKIHVIGLSKKTKNTKMRFLCEGSYKNRELSSLIEFPKLIGASGKCKIGLNCDIGLFPYSFKLNSNDRISIESNIKANLEKLTVTILPDEIACWGNLESSFSISGTPQTPSISGKLTLNNGGIEKISSGTYINDLNLHIESDKSNNLICQASATDASHGKATISGKIKLVKKSINHTSPFLDIIVNFQNFKIIDEDDLIVSVDGDSYLKGHIDGLRYSGNLTMPYVLVDIDTTYNDNKGDIQILEYGKHIDVLNKKKICVQLPFKCNISLNCKKLELKGKLLNSTWRGDVCLVGGGDKEAALAGILKLKKGNFLFLGRTIPIIQGTISYYEKSPFIPIVNMYASKDIGIAKVTANIKQNAGEVTFYLKSEPFMPLEAVFSYLLFGKAQHSLTLLETLQVSSVVSIIKNQSNKTFSLLESIGQNKNTEDQIQYNNPNTRNISLGRYIGDSIYVSVENDTTNKVAYMKVQVSFSPKLSGEATSLGEAGVNWQKRY